VRCHDDIGIRRIGRSPDTTFSFSGQDATRSVAAAAAVAALCQDPCAAMITSASGASGVALTLPSASVAIAGAAARSELSSGCARAIKEASPRSSEGSEGEVHVVVVFAAVVV
jgi:hypothetical protein